MIDYFCLLTLGFDGGLGRYVNYSFSGVLPMPADAVPSVVFERVREVAEAAARRRGITGTPAVIFYQAVPDIPAPEVTADAGQ
jgi:hypothetical protein